MEIASIAHHLAQCHRACRLLVRLVWRLHLHHHLRINLPILTDRYESRHWINLTLLILIMFFKMIIVIGIRKWKPQFKLPSQCH
jgi:hypothetical protein